MSPEQILSLIDFFNQISISLEETTTEKQRQDGYKVLKATYSYRGKSYTTKPLHYRKVDLQEEVRMLPLLKEFFEDNAYWLDHKIHPWPKGTGEAEVEHTIIDDMVNGEDPEFISFLKLLANNTKSGAIQKMTWEGRSQQYGYNLENNNHWHDLTLLIKEFIKSGGKDVDKTFFAPLIFNWYDGERSSLHKRFGARAIIDKLSENIQSIQPLLAQQMIKKILKNKHQIILQGPPGTGKTKKAFELATELALENLNPALISAEFIAGYLKPGMVLQTPDGTEFTVQELTQDKVVTRLSTGSIYPVTYDQIVKCIIEDVDKNLPRSYGRGIGNFIKNKIVENQSKLIQFHPSYSYEDFVRGINVQNIDGQVIYRTENKILANIALEAKENYEESLKNSEEYSKGQWIKATFEEYSETVADKILASQKYELEDSFFIKNIDVDKFVYYRDGWYGNGAGFSISKTVILDTYLTLTNEDVSQIIDVKELYPHGVKALRFILKDFINFLKDKPQFIEIPNPGLKNYVLIIDEINRANLSSVLGELIYALEYRGRDVESMYEIDGSRKLKLPPNLFIIGTMNTADRSVGHIDYAIRRRFAFVEVLPTIEPVKEHARPLFKKVSEVFISNFDAIDWSRPVPEKSAHLAPDFRPEDVWIGHSYFITQSEAHNGAEELRLKLEYEIKPILMEYLKDGILLESAKALIDALH